MDLILHNCLLTRMQTAFIAWPAAACRHALLPQLL